jgi:hypothetical protein
MGTYDKLHEAVGKPEMAVKPPDSFFNSPEAKADEELADLWREEGWARYGGGLFWTVDPRDFDGLDKEWPVAPAKSVVFGRNAFGDLFLLHEGEVYRLAVQWGRLFQFGPSADIFLNSTLREPSLHASLLQPKLFKAVRKRLGELEPDECYGLFPALPLGGNEEDPNSYRRVKLREYLASLAQMHS